MIDGTRRQAGLRPRLRWAAVVGAVLALFLIAEPARATDPTVAAGSPSVVFTITDSTGLERVVSVEELGRELESNGQLAFAGDVSRVGGEVAPLVVSRREGRIMVTWNVYFNKRETDQIAAAGGASVALGYVLGKIPSAPTAVVAAITQLGGSAIVAWALSARATNSCVGIKTPLVGVRFPLPIYHRSGFCF